ncbi:MAG: hypothetical protein QG657_5910 [Acidobacteriota bacterium]|nr:hypothetical protein [Acidobacteriota bacterium]
MSPTQYKRIPTPYNDNCTNPFLIFLLITGFYVILGGKNHECFRKKKISKSNQR